MIRLLRLLKRPKQGSSKATVRPREIFSWDPSGEKIFEFSLLKRLILVYFVFFEWRRSAQNVAGPGVTYQSLSLDGPASE